MAIKIKTYLWWIMIILSLSCTILLSIGTYINYLSYNLNKDNTAKINYIYEVLGDSNSTTITK